MKRIKFILAVLLFLFSANAYGLDTGILDVRNKIFNESGQIKLFLNSTKDVILANSLRDTCIISTTQLDAYFSMLGVFNLIRDPLDSREALKYLTDWLTGIKKTGELNSRGLDDAMKNTLDDKTKVHILRLKGYYLELNSRLDAELNKLSAIGESLKINKK